MRRFLLALLLIAATETPARAHEGPPYAAVVDQKVGPYVLSVWTDPDVGTGTFFVIFDPPALGSETDPRVFVEVWPSTGRLPPARHDTHRQRDHAYKAEVPFDQEELWKVKVLVEGSRGSGEAVFEVPVTPPGYGAWDLLIYFTPFLVLGGLWVAVSVKRRRMAAGGG
jgi:hypothetical protein